MRDLCACQMAAMLTRETSELTGMDLLSPDQMAFQLNLKLRFLHLLLI